MKLRLITTAPPLVLACMGALMLASCDAGTESDPEQGSGESDGANTSQVETTPATAEEETEVRFFIPFEDPNPVVVDEDAPEHEKKLVEFINYMRQGDIERAALLVDPAAPGYEDFDTAIGFIASVGDKRDSTYGIAVSDFIRTQFSVVYHTVGYLVQDEGENEDVVSYVLAFDEAEPVSLADDQGNPVLMDPGRPGSGQAILHLHRLDGQWYLFPEKSPSGIIRPVPLDPGGESTPDGRQQSDWQGSGPQVQPPR